MMKLARVLWAFCIALILFVGMQTYFLFKPTVLNSAGVVFYLKPNMSKKTLLLALEEHGLLPRGLLLRQSLLLFNLLPNHIQLKTGEYLFSQKATPFSILKQITQGKGLVYRRFTIIPGWSFQQFREALAKKDDIVHSAQYMSDSQLMNKLGLTAQNMAEGLFFPDTYFYTRDLPDIVLYKKAFNLMKTKLNQAWLQRAPNLPYQTAYQALIVASLVEKEAYLNAERPLIAGVIVNRLRNNMLLQIDPTVIYGMGKNYKGKIYQSNLREDTAYNTYMHKGLPPTPIALPSMASINAALHPTPHSYFYFVDKGDGSHQFSEKLTEHHRMVKIMHQSGYFNATKLKRILINQLFTQLFYSENSHEWFGKNINT